MARDNTAERCVFVGNIPYDAKEEDLKTFFEKVGPVVSFRLIRDRESNKPKGYGFCEFFEKEYARSAIRNMNEIEFSGRSLRVDYSEKHRSALQFPEVPRQQNSVQDVLSRVTPQEGMYLLGLLQQYAYYNEEELYQVLKAKPYLLFALLKLMHRMNNEYTDFKAPRPQSNMQEGLLPLPAEDFMFMPPYYNMRPY